MIDDLIKYFDITFKGELARKQVVQDEDSFKSNLLNTVRQEWSLNRPKEGISAIFSLVFQTANIIR